MARDQSLAVALSILPEEQRYLVTCEGAFAYLANDYKLKEIYLWAINDESGGSPQHVAEVIDLVKANKIPAVFCESTVSSGIQEEVALASGAKLGGVLYVDSLSGPEGPASTYLTQLSHTVDTIISGLTQ
jgi:manganese transport system substrate-binding protein